jgi:hypothetical protein
VTSEIRTPLGEDHARALGPAEHRHQDGGVDAAAGLHRQRLLGREQLLGEAQMITWTVPPSTDQAAPLT